MSPEESIELHEQWLRSMESNQSQFAADLASFHRQMDRMRVEFGEQLDRMRVEFGEQLDRMRAEFGEQLDRTRAAFAEQDLVLLRNQGVFMEALARLTTRMEEEAGSLRRLEEIVERYIRFSGDGGHTS